MHRRRLEWIRSTAGPIGVSRCHDDPIPLQAISNSAGTKPSVFRFTASSSFSRNPQTISALLALALV